MPNRIIRESLLDSDRYLGVDEGAQLLFTHLLLLADDFGCLSIGPAFIGRRCFVERPSNERLDALLEQLAVADLIRIYEHRGARFAFIPRFRQRLKRETLKNPQPPDELLVDDFDAQEKFKRLNGHTYKGAAVGQSAGGRSSAARPPAPKEHIGSGPSKEVNRSEESELKGIDQKAAPAEARVNPVAAAEALAAKMRAKENS